MRDYVPFSTVHLFVYFNICFQYLPSLTFLFEVMRYGKLYLSCLNYNKNVNEMKLSSVTLTNRTNQRFYTILEAEHWQQRNLLDERRLYSGMCLEVAMSCESAFPWGSSFVLELS